MILAAGLSPAWQQILVLPALHVGEVNRAAECHWCGSGKVLNVGLALHHLGADVHVLAPLGGLPGRSICEEFQTFGMASTWIETQTSTRVCTTILDGASGQTTELVENANPLSTGELQSFRVAFQQLASRADLIVVSGSLPSGTDPGFWQPLLAGLGERCVLDIRGADLLAVLPARPLLVKPNREELGKTLGRTFANEADVVAAMHEVRRAGAANVLVTDGKRPALLLTAEGLFTLTPPVIPSVNPIGCGDCLAAGFALALSQGRTVYEAAVFGMAAAAENLRELLPARLEEQRVRDRAKAVQLGSRSPA